MVGLLRDVEMALPCSCALIDHSDEDGFAPVVHLDTRAAVGVVPAGVLPSGNVGEHGTQITISPVHDSVFSVGTGNSGQGLLGCVQVVSAVRGSAYGHGH